MIREISLKVQVVSGKRLQMQWMQVHTYHCQETMLLAKTSEVQSTKTSSAFWLHGFNKKQHKVLKFDLTKEDEPECASQLQQTRQTQEKLQKEQIDYFKFRESE